MANVPDAIQHDANLKRLYEECPLEDFERNIRLLRFMDWKTEDDEISCSLDSTFEEPHPSYAAISYTWGDPTKLKIVTVNGLRINVRANCWYALWQVRRLRSNHLVWIDSICINQDDVAEKSAQVFIMGDIYMSSTEMYACVGPHEDDSEYLISNISAIVESYEDHRRQDNLSRHVSWSSSFKYLKVRKELFTEMGQDSYERLQNAAVAFGSRNYWTRAWVAQEINLSKMQRLLIGNEAVEWPSVSTLLLAVESEVVSRRLSQAMRDNLDLLYDDLILHMSFKEMFNLNRESRDLASIASYDFAATDPRDRIFALRKLTAWPAMLGEIYPDYTKTKIQVAREMLRYFEAQENLPGNRWTHTLFDFARNLLRILDISAKDSEFQDILRRSDEAVTAETVSSHDRAAGNKQKQVFFGVPLGFQRSYHISKNGCACDTEPKRSNKCIFGDRGLHWIAVFDSGAKCGDIVVRVMGEDVLLILREYADFFEIVGSGFINYTDGACTKGPSCQCYDDAVHIMDTHACETEIVVDEIDLWSFVSREWDVVREGNPTGDASDVLSDLLESLSAHKLSSLAIRRPTDSALLEAGEEGYQHWEWNST